jgi:hypothetical protein
MDGEKEGVRPLQRMMGGSMNRGGGGGGSDAAVAAAAAYRLHLHRRSTRTTPTHQVQMPALDPRLR